MTKLSRIGGSRKLEHGVNNGDGTRVARVRFSRKHVVVKARRLCCLQPSSPSVARSWNQCCVYGIQETRSYYHSKRFHIVPHLFHMQGKLMGSRYGSRHKYIRSTPHTILTLIESQITFFFTSPNGWSQRFLLVIRCSTIILYLQQFVCALP